MGQSDTVKSKDPAEAGPCVGRSRDQVRFIELSTHLPN